MKINLSTLCYIERENQYLMLHRVKKGNDINKDKWIGVGGHFLPGESPEECLTREVLEETGYRLENYHFRGIVTFVYGESGDEIVEYMHLFSASDVVGEPADCKEGILAWISKEKILELELWEGDRIFLKLLEQRRDFFTLKLVYSASGILKKAILDGKTKLVHEN